MHEDLEKFCPNCKPVIFEKRNIRTGVKLETISSNYSGCGVDICVCPECKKQFQVSYKVDQITPLDTD
jgi:hypothetical protein